MGQRFVCCDREQSFLLPPDVREWLAANHLAWFVISAVEQMNLDVFYAAYRVDGRSRPAYDPAMMVALLLVTNEHQVILAAEVETVGADFRHLEPRRYTSTDGASATGIGASWAGHRWWRLNAGITGAATTRRQ